MIYHTQIINWHRESPFPFLHQRIYFFIYCVCYSSGNGFFPGCQILSRVMHAYSCRTWLLIHKQYRIGLHNALDSVPKMQNLKKYLLQGFPCKVIHILCFWTMFQSTSFICMAHYQNIRHFPGIASCSNIWLQSDMPREAAGTDSFLQLLRTIISQPKGDSYVPSLRMELPHNFTMNSHHKEH